MPRKPKFKSAEHKKALADHEAWLKARGLPTQPVPKSRLRGVAFPAQPPRSDLLPPTSDRVLAVGCSVKDRTLVEAQLKLAATVQVSFNKGPLQPITNRQDWIDSKRRA